MKLSKISIGIESGVTLISVCKNRQHHLVKLLESISCYNEIDEIIIVDWSSDESIRPLIKQFQNGRIKLAEVPGQDNFLRCHAFNLAARLATRDKLIKLDADIQVKGNFFARYPIPEKSFYAGKVELARDQNEYGLTGLLYLKRSDFFDVNGYNEYLKNWGCEDIDLYKRLVGIGLEWMDIDYDYFYHTPHEERFLNVSDFLSELNLSDRELEMFFDNKNKIILESFSWANDKIMTDFEINELDKNTFECFVINIDDYILPTDAIEMGNAGALKFLINKKLRLPEDIFKNYSYKDMFQFYNLLLNVDKDTALKVFMNYLYEEIAERDTRIKNIGDEYTQAIDNIKKSISWKIGDMVVSTLAYIKNMLNMIINKI